MKKLTKFEKALQEFLDEHDDVYDPQSEMIDAINVFLNKGSEDDTGVGVVDKQKVIDDLKEIIKKIEEIMRLL